MRRCEAAELEKQLKPIRKEITDHTVNAGVKIDGPYAAGAVKRGGVKVDRRFWFCEGVAEGATSWNTLGMYGVEISGRIRRAVLVEGGSQRSVEWEFWLAPRNSAEDAGYSLPPGSAGTRAQAYDINLAMPSQLGVARFATIGQ